MLNNYDIFENCIQNSIKISNINVNEIYQKINSQKRILNNKIYSLIYGKYKNLKLFVFDQNQSLAFGNFTNWQKDVLFYGNTSVHRTDLLRKDRQSEWLGIITSGTYIILLDNKNSTLEELRNNNKFFNSNIIKKFISDDLDKFDTNIIKKYLL